ncbi:hypothetical protein ACM41_26420 [Bradyrhizobium sp. CCBAU 21362]|uniref:hypothetical protein n=1 Tax=Bradyrhizobium sp. CCBAU 21362 TaxID=1325082 RepID=UPI002305F7C9|nr:hypothetical protein [Bradyrhizobium sp. CCBAU 21362]MDA9539638.1 hypothetical protein [Bradyrhizobium sp. CCBAU 21362]
MEQHVPALPPRDYLHNDAFMAEWEAMTPSERGYASRRAGELKRGIAIQKDRIMGRPKYALYGFYGLERADEDVYRLERIPKKAAELEEARTRAAKLRAALVEDEEHVESVVARNAALDEFHQIAAAQGVTLSGYLRRAHTVEQAFYRAQAALHAGDVVGVTDGIMDGLCQLGDWIGFDPVEVLLNADRRPSEAH